ncbi:MAG: hypothetical protein JXA67_10960 [Micromonosporaceae bacterium]|nr:hypothetical protein [Micromonosporaceae bacterium]
MSRTQWVAFEPRDTIMVRDGRSFDAGADAVGEPVLPGPSTVAGAVRTAYGNEDVEVVRGPLYARWHPDERRWQTLLPVPRTIVADDPYTGPLRHLRPQPFPGLCTNLAPECPQWLAGDGEPLDRCWMTGEAMTRYLRGELFPAPVGTGRGGDDVGGGGGGAMVGRAEAMVGRTEAGLVPIEEVLAREPRIGLARDPDRQARQGMLYQMGHHRVHDGFALLAECELDESWSDRRPAGPTPLGGQARLADASEANLRGGEPISKTVDWPKGPEDFPGGRMLIYVATVAPWTTGWCPPIPPGASLVAAAVGEPVPIATSSPRRGWRATRQLRWGVPPGSVYLVTFGDGGGEAARVWAAAHHGKAWGMAEGRDPNDKIITAGFGVILTGVWS